MNAPALKGDGRWTPLEHCESSWQAIREAYIGAGVQRFYDTAIDRLEEPTAVRRSVTFSSELACQIRCDELNRRRHIGAVDPRCSCLGMPSGDCVVHGP